MFEKNVLGPPTGEPIEINIIGNYKNYAQLLKTDITDILNKIDGVTDIDDDQKEGKKELKLNFDYDKMAQLGINVASVSQAVRTAYEGMVATSIQTTNEELDFRVKIDDAFQRDERFLMDLLVPNKLGRLIRLNDFATYNVQKSKSIINHYNSQRVITITANIVGDKTTPSNVMERVKTWFEEQKTHYPGIELKYGGEAQETKETLKDLAFAFIIAIILIYFVLILLFKSLGQPIIVMVTIPFGIIGAILALIIHGIPLSFLAMIGIIGLSGVIVNDSVIMVDFINKVFRADKKKENLRALIATGAKKRLRPVILTTLTTVAGLLPTIYGLGGDAGMLVPIVMSIAYGLSFATTLTLIFIPALYMIRLDVLMLFKR